MKNLLLYIRGVLNLYLFLGIFFVHGAFANPLLAVQLKRDFDRDAAQYAVDSLKVVAFRYGVWFDPFGYVQYPNSVASDLEWLKSSGKSIVLTLRYPFLANHRVANGYIYSLGRRLGLFAIDHEYVKGKGWGNIYWEILNEPDLPEFWDVRLDQSSFDTFLKGYCDVFLNLSKVGFLNGAAGFSGDPRYSPKINAMISSMQKAGCFDFVSFHPYGKNVSDINEIGVFLKNNFNFDFIVSEWGVPRKDQYGNDINRKAYIKSMVRNFCNLQARIFSIYELQDTVRAKNAREQTFGIFSADGKFTDLHQELLNRSLCD